MIKVQVVAVGKIKEKAFLEAAGEYIKRLGAFCDITVTEIKPAVLPENPSASEINAALLSEAAAITAKVPANSAVFPLCIEGRPLSSEEFAKSIADLEAVGKSICFVVGGSHGLHESIKNLGKGISFSKMTFPHRLFRVMLLEQIYRAFSINAGKKYHK